MYPFKLHAKYKPAGGQPAAIDSLVKGIGSGLRTQVLLGVTGSGKTFTMANIIAALNRPALVIAHNKTLAAQLTNEFREFFPENRVEFFVSYYDYYQPESYIPSRDLFIEKEIDINEEIDKLRHSATCSLYERRDTIVVASVSCIYGLGAPEQYYKMAISLRAGDKLNRNALMRRLVEIHYERNDIDCKRGSFRVRGDIVEIFPANWSERAVRVEFFGDEIERICETETVSGRVTATLSHAAVFPASHYSVEKEITQKAAEQIERDLDVRVAELKAENKPLEAFRLHQRVNYDLEMMREIGYCTGIENYSRYFDGRKAGEPPYTLLDYFPRDFITFIDESHMTIPQVRGMYAGDRARKTNLVEYGFRLPSAYDNRPLNFAEFDARIKQMICVSATPAPYELEQADNVAEQIIRPTGLLDPVVAVKKTAGQVDDLMEQIHAVTAAGGRVLVTTLTKRMAEDLAKYLNQHGVKIKYMHSDIDTLERIQIVNGLRRGDFDVLVGINLLREGLDLPEVRLVAVLDADKEGFLRSEQSLIQTIGRAARNSEGRVILYADTVTGSMRRALDVTENRRRLQDEYNKQHGITPRTIVSDVKNSLEITKKADDADTIKIKEIPKEIEKLKRQMDDATARLDFELAIILRESIAKLRKKITS